MRSAPLPSTVSLRSVSLLPRLPASLRLRGRDHGRAPAVDLDNQDFAIVVGHRPSGSVEKAAGRCADRVDHAQRRPGARRPLMKLGKEAPGIAKGQHRAELRDGRHGAQAEAAAQPQLTIYGQIGSTTATQRTTDWPRKPDFAEARADVCVAARGCVQRIACTIMLVSGGARPARRTRQEQPHQRTTQGKQRRPQLRLRGRQRHFLALRDRGRRLHCALDLSARKLDTARHGVLSGWCSCFATGYLPELSPYFQPTRANRSISLCFSSADRELHPIDIVEFYKTDVVGKS